MRKPLAVLLAGAIAAACAPTAPVTLARSPGAARSGAPLANQDLAPGLVQGRLLVPAGILSNNGSSVVANNGGAVGDPLPSTYRPLALPVSGAAGIEIVATDTSGTPLADASPVRTDAQGAFRLVGLPTARTILVMARATGPGGKPLLLQTLTRASVAGTTADITAASGMVAVAVLDGLSGPAGAVDLPALDAATRATAGALTPENLPDLTDRAAMIRALDALAKALVEVRVALDEVKGQLRDIRADLAEIKAELRRTPAPGESPASSPVVGPTATPPDPTASATPPGPTASATPSGPATPAPGPSATPGGSGTPAPTASASSTPTPTPTPLPLFGPGGAPADGLPPGFTWLDLGATSSTYYADGDAVAIAPGPLTGGPGVGFVATAEGDFRLTAVFEGTLPSASYLQGQLNVYEPGNQIRATLGRTNTAGGNGLPPQRGFSFVAGVGPVASPTASADADEPDRYALRLTRQNNAFRPEYRGDLGDAWKALPVAVLTLPRAVRLHVSSSTPLKVLGLKLEAL